MGSSINKPTPGTPRQLGKYELIAKVGTGGMAEVYLARQVGPMNFQKVVVVKLIHPHLSSQSQFVEMFLDEARVSALIKHQNVVDIYDLGHEGEVFFIAMEFIPGQALSRMISKTRSGDRQLDIFTTSKIIADAANGLDAAHNLTSITGDRLELVHRDVSPANILVSYAGAVKLLDFGVSQSLAQLSTTESSVLKGKIGYSSPEQLNAAPIDHRSDIFSLGVVLWESLALERLYRAESPAATVKKILDGNPPPPSFLRLEVPRELDDIVATALSLKPEDRYQTVVEMRDALLSFLRDANYYGDHRQISSFMKEVFADERAAEKALIKAVVEAEEEIQVDIDIASELATEDGVPIAADAEADDDLEAEMIVVSDERARMTGKVSTVEAPHADATAGLRPFIIFVAVGLVVIIALVYLLTRGGDAKTGPGGKAVDVPDSQMSSKNDIESSAANKVAAARATAASISRREAEKLAQSLCNQGDAELAAGHQNEARAHYEAALRSVEAMPRALRGLGVSHARDGTNDKARYYLDKYLSASPDAADADWVRALRAELD